MRRSVLLHRGQCQPRLLRAVARHAREDTRALSRAPKGVDRAQRASCEVLRLWHNDTTPSEAARTALTCRTSPTHPQRTTQCRYAPYQARGIRSEKKCGVLTYPARYEKIFTRNAFNFTSMPVR